MAKAIIYTKYHKDYATQWALGRCRGYKPGCADVGRVELERLEGGEARPRLRLALVSVFKS
jgi:hypothetical protein